jgi:hypothetical protein
MRRAVEALDESQKSQKCRKVYKDSQFPPKASRKDRGKQQSIFSEQTSRLKLDLCSQAMGQ